MKRVISILLVLVMSLGLFAGCLEKEEDTYMPVLETPTAYATFAGTTAAGVAVGEPADLKVTGTSEVKKVSVLVGDNDGSYTVRTLKGFDSEMSFTLSGVTANKPAMIDIEEIHLRTDEAVAYSVFINGTEVFGRTYAPIADGPNHAFFDVPAEVVGDSTQLQVRLVNKTEDEVRFSRIWAISDPETMAAEQGISKKMDMVLMLNEIPMSLNYNYLVNLVKSYQCDNMYNVGLCWEINYLHWGKIKTEEFLNNVLIASMMTGAPLYLGINSWWAGTPDAMDGQGGYWQDVQYQQITYDPNNNDGRGNWQLTTPNEFGSTPWLSMNNDYYNATRVQRIKETVEFIQRRTAELALAGRDIPPIHLYTENEPYYWPINWTKYDFDNYPNGVGDFSAWVVEDAAKDGITLDPTDGLSQEEAFWLYRNLNTYISEVGSAMAEGLGYNYITIQNGVVTYPKDQMVNDSFSHSPIHTIYPNWEDNRRAWENHILDSIHFGGEWSVYQDDGDSRSLDYLLAYGSFANINAERAGFPGGFDSTDFRVLSQCYAYGLEGVIIYNVLKDTDQKNVIGASNAGATQMPLRTFAAGAVFQSDFSSRVGYSVSNVLVDISGLRWDGTSVIPKEEFGKLTYRIRNAANYSSGLGVVTEGIFADPAGKLEILVGTSPEDLKSVGTFNSATSSVQIDPSAYAGGQDIYIQIKVGGEGLSSSQLAGLNLSKVTINWGGIINGRADGSVYTYDENRVRCQIIAQRADTERMLSKYIQRAGGELTTKTQKDAFAAAYNLYVQGRYGEAFTSISQSISQLLPATFVVSGYGQLGTYPVEIAVDSDAKVQVTLKEVSDSSVRFTMSSSGDAKITVSLLTNSGKWSLKQEGEDWLITAGDTAPSGGKVSFTVDEKERISKLRPSEFEARILLTDPNTLTVRSQDIRVTDYCYYGLFPFSSASKVYRAIDGTEKSAMPQVDPTQLMPGDYVQVKLNDKGLVEEVYAWYGKITGTVESVEEMSLAAGDIHNPFVTVRLEDGTTKRLEIGAECLLSFTGATGDMGKNIHVESVGLKVGQKITVVYSPYTVNDRTRAMEITD